MRGKGGGGRAVAWASSAGDKSEALSSGELARFMLNMRKKEAPTSSS